MGAGFPYMCMVCGEPCGVWRRSAPLLLFVGGYKVKLLTLK